MRSKKKFLQVGLALAVVGVLIFFGNTPSGERIRSGAAVAAGPLQGGASSVRSFFGFGSAVSGDEALRLVAENQALTARLAAFDELKAENERLRAALRFDARDPETIRGAAVTLYMKEFGREVLVVDRGTEAGFADGMAAVTADGIFVGTIREAGNGFSKIAIATDAGTAWEGELPALGGKILLKGIGGRTFSVELIPNDVPVRRGDYVNVRIPGVAARLPAAEVVSAEPQSSGAFQLVRAALIARPEMLREVFVIIPRR